MPCAPYCHALIVEATDVLAQFRGEMRLTVAKLREVQPRSLLDDRRKDIAVPLFAASDDVKPVSAERRAERVTGEVEQVIGGEF